MQRIRGFKALDDAAREDMSTFIQKAKTIPQGDREILYDRVQRSIRSGKQHLPSLLIALKATFASSTERQHDVR